MRSITLLSLTLSTFVSVALSQTITPYCPTYNGQQYTQPSNNQTYTIYCNQDTSPASTTNSFGITSFASCISLCDASTTCRAASYVASSKACYLKTGFRSNSTSSGVYTAVKYIAPPPYPAPQINYANASIGCGVPLPAGQTAGGASTRMTFEYTGISRSYMIHIPATYNVNAAAPLILVFHGRGSSGASIESISQLSSPQWNPYGIVIYPDGVNQQWQGDPAVLTQPSDDLGFIDAFLTYLQSQYCVDTNRVWSTGQSNGGGFSNVMACDTRLSKRFTAFGISCGAFYTQTTDAQCTDPSTVVTNDLVENCTPGRANIPILEIHGTSDGTIPYNGGTRRGYCLPTLPHWAKDWAIRQNFANITANTSTIASGSVARYEWGGSVNNGLVTHLAISNWDHVWATMAAGAPIDSAPQMMNFFYRFTNPNGPAYDYLDAQSQMIAARALDSSASTSTSASNSASTTASGVGSVGPDGITSVAYPPSCTAINTNVYAVTDTANVAYLFMCGGGTAGTYYASPTAPRSWRDCFALCEANGACTGFSYVNGALMGEGAGVCWFKNANPQSFASTTSLLPTRIAAIRRDKLAFTTTTITTTTTTTSSSSSSSPSSSTTTSSESLSLSTTTSSTSSSSSSSLSVVSTSSLQSSESTTSSSSTTTVESTSSSLTTSTMSTSTVMSTTSSDSASSLSSMTLSSTMSSVMTSSSIVSSTDPAAPSSSVTSTSSDETTTPFVSMSSSSSTLPTILSTSAASTNNPFTSSWGSCLATRTIYVTATSSATDLVLPSITTTSKMSSQTYPACPSANNTVQYDVSGNAYQILCQTDSAAVPNLATQQLNSFFYSDCFQYCTNNVECTGFTYYGEVCYLKRQQDLQLFATTNPVTAAVLLNKTTSGTISSSGPLQPDSSSTTTDSGMQTMSSSFSSMTSMNSEVDDQTMTSSPSAMTTDPVVTSDDGPTSSDVQTTSDGGVTSTDMQVPSDVPMTSSDMVTDTPTNSAMTAISTSDSVTLTDDGAETSPITATSGSQSTETSNPDNGNSETEQPSPSTSVDNEPVTTSSSSASSVDDPVSSSTDNNPTTGTFASTSTSPTSTFVPAPVCADTQSACGSNNSTTCNDQTGTAYFYACDIVPTGGTIMQTQSRRSLLERQSYGNDFEDCNLQCSNTRGCMAFTYQSSNDECTLYSSLTGGYASSPGTQFGLAQPQQNLVDPYDPNTSSSSSSSSTTITVTATDGGQYGGGGQQETVTSTVPTATIAPDTTLVIPSGGPPLTTTISQPGYGGGSTQSTTLTGNNGVSTSSFSAIVQSTPGSLSVSNTITTTTTATTTTTTTSSGNVNGGTNTVLTSSSSSNGNSNSPTTITITKLPSTCPVTNNGFGNTATSVKSTVTTTVYSLTYSSTCMVGSDGIGMCPMTSPSLSTTSTMGTVNGGGVGIGMGMRMHRREI